MSYSNYRLKQHFKYHVDKKAFICEKCAVTFSETKLLAKHLRPHTGKTPYLREICSKRFTPKNTFYYISYRKKAIHLLEAF